jgi:hypothetical protein
MRQSGSNGNNEGTIEPKRSIIVNVGMRIIAIELLLAFTLSNCKTINYLN